RTGFAHRLRSDRSSRPSCRQHVGFRRREGRTTPGRDRTGIDWSVARLATRATRPPASEAETWRQENVRLDNVSYPAALCSASRCAPSLRPPRERRCRVRASWPAIQHFTEEVVVSRQGAQHGTKTYGRNIQDTVRRAWQRWAGCPRASLQDNHLLSLRETNAMLQHHDAIVYATTDNHSDTSFG